MKTPQKNHAKKSDRDPTDQFELKIEDTASQKARGVAARLRSGVSGYNPYDTVPADSAKPEESRRPTDLRKLSEWIRLQRQVAALKKHKP